MKLTNWVGATAVTLIAFMFQPSALAAPSYTLQLIPLPKGAGFSSMQAYAISDSGQVTGFGQNSNGYRAFLFDGTKTVDIGGLSVDGLGNRAFSLNATGTVVGNAGTATGSAAFIYSNAIMSVIPGSLPNDTGLSINALGAVSSNLGYVYKQGATKIPALPSEFRSEVTGYGINESGAVTGGAYVYTSSSTYINRAYLWPGSGNSIDLGTLGGNYSYGWAVNNQNQVVGESQLSTPTIRAFLWKDGVMSDLGVIAAGGANYSSAFSINDSGQVVGISSNASPGVLRPFVVKNGKMIDLFTLVSKKQTQGWTSGQARSINQHGDIAGFGSYKGVTRGFIFKPITNRR